MNIFEDEYKYHNLPEAWQAKDNKFFVPAGKFNEKERKQVEVDIVDHEKKTTKKKLLIFEKTQGKVKIFDKDAKDIDIERGFDHLSDD